MKEIPQQLNGSDCGMFACKISVETLVCLLWGCVFRLVAEVYVPSNSWHPQSRHTSDGDSCCSLLHNSSVLLVGQPVIVFYFVGVSSIYL